MKKAAPCDKIHVDSIMIIAAFRYCLGRQSYIVSNCTNWLKLIWSKLDSQTQHVILRDIKEAQVRGALGMACDRKDWESVLELGVKP